MRDFVVQGIGPAGPPGAQRAEPHRHIGRVRRMLLRPFAPADTEGIIALIDGVYREHGDEICLTDADSDLLDIPARYLAPGGAFVVLDDQGAIRGSHAVLPFADRPGVCTFRRLYMDPAIRGSGWGETLMQWAFDWAQAHALSRVEFWSDT